MTILHVVRCDGDECTTEAPLICSSGANYYFHNPNTLGNVPPPLPSASYIVPSEWPQVDGRQFCSYRCLADFADAKAKGQG